MKRKIAIVTGSRADYGYLYPLFKEVMDNGDLILQLYVTGMHLVRTYGSSEDEIKKNGFDCVIKIDMGMKYKNTLKTIGYGISKGIRNFVDSFLKDTPDIVIVFGDRIEAFTAAIAASSLNLPLAHIAGGDVASGDIDDNLRHAITKLSHLHFVMSKQSEQRVLKLGEEKWRVFQVGALSLDRILNNSFDKGKFLHMYGFPIKPLLLVLYHPLTTEINGAVAQIKIVMNAAVEIAKRHSMEIVVIYPNYYPGASNSISYVQSLKKRFSDIRIIKNLSHEDFITLMSCSRVFIGNSSSGIIESPSLGIPYVSIGTRQKTREQASNVIDVACQKNEIIEAIHKALFDTAFLKIVKKRKTPYGNGTATKQIVQVLQTITLNTTLLQKHMTY